MGWFISKFSPLLFAVVLGCVSSLGEAEEVQVKWNGLTLNGHFQRAGETETPRAAVLLVHGTMAHLGMETIATLQTLLSELGHTSLAITLSLNIDARVGPFPCAQPHRHRHQNAVGEISAWADWLSQQGFERIALLGHSRGGNQVARAGLTGGIKNLSALILLAPMTYDSLARAERYQERHGEALDAVLQRAAAAPETAVMDKTGFLSCPDASVQAGSFISYYADDGQFDTPALLAGIAYPTLVLVAGADRVVVDLAERMQAVTATHVQTVVIEDADHLFLDFFAEDAAEAIDTFLRQ